MTFLANRDKIKYHKRKGIYILMKINELFHSDTITLYNGLSLKILRQQKKYSGEQVAKKLNVTPTTYYKWEKNPKLMKIQDYETLLKILSEE